MGRPATTVRVTALAVCILYTAVLVFTGVSLDSFGKKVVGWLPTLAGAGVVAWDLWIWRLPGVQWLTHRPRLDGLWRATLEPTDESHIPEGGNRGPIEAFLVIRQSFWSLHIRQYTAESTSDSRAHVWTVDGGAGWHRVAFLYDNLPAARHQHRSTRHLGACQLDPTSQRPSAMGGVYFTDRYTKGDMQLALVDRSSGYASFEACLRHARSTSGG